MKISEIQTIEYDPYYGKYIGQLSPDIGLRDGFENGFKATEMFFKSIPHDKVDYRYDVGKWNIKEVYQHLIDTERIFIYRCFRIARNDKTPLSGYDQDDYITPSHASQKSMTDLSSEYRSTRDFSISILNSLSNEDLKCVGNASNTTMSARAAAAIIIGHEIWHAGIIRERYL